MVKPVATISYGHGRCLDGPIPGAAWISGSVGRGGANRRDDTLAVQAALNRVPAALGGAGESLDEDGLCGPLTVGAIEAFQRRWLTVRDARCDPAGPTLGLLNAMAGVGDALPCGAAAAHAAADGPPVEAASANAAFAPAAHETAPVGKGGPKPKPKPPSAAERKLQQLKQIADAEMRHFLVERFHLPAVSRMLSQALLLVGAASVHVARLRGLHGAKPPADQRDTRERKAFLLVAKTFRLHESRIGQADAALRFIDLILTRAQIVASANVPRVPRVAPAPDRFGPLFVSLFSHKGAGSPGDNAFAIAGGLHLKPGPSGFFHRSVVPGRVVPERTNRIYLLPNFDNQTANFQRHIVVHELAHFCGATKGPRSVPDHAYLHEPAKWKRLNAEQRLHTADSYAYLATELELGTVPAIEEVGSDNQHIPIYPIAGNANVGFGFKVSIGIPEAPREHHEKFDFPAGAMF